MKKLFILPLISLLLAGFTSCELANVYRPSDEEAAEILDNIQKVFLPAIYDKASIGNDSKNIVSLNETSENGLIIEGTLTTTPDSDPYFATMEITLTAEELEVDVDNISYIDGNINFYIKITTDQTATNDYQGELTVIYQDKELQVKLNITSEIDIENNTMKDTGTYSINGQEIAYKYNGPAEK